MKQRSPKTSKYSEHGQKNKSIFACDPQSPAELSSEGIKADCLNHGYRITKTLGEGAYAKVKLAEVMASRLARNEALSENSEFTDGELQVAIKIISKSSVPKEFLTKFLPREVENHTKMPEHPNVVRIYDHFSTNNHVYLVMDYCRNGDLLDLINKHIGTNQKGIGEELSRKLFRQLCEALQHIHTNGVVHRDLKCENVLLDANMDAKLTDFGFSASIQDPKTLLRTSCGSYAYTAPEVIRNKPYEGFKSDIWSLGIILFAMINGRLPFNDTEMLEMDEDMKMQRLRFERATTFDCMVLIRKLLQYHPAERPCLDDILNEPWITGKKPIPRQLQRPKWINPYQAKKKDEKEVPHVIHAPKEVVSLPPSMRNNTICYRPVSSPKIYTESLSGTVTVNHKAGETVTLKSRSGRVFQNKIDVTDVQSRPNTWPKSIDASKLPTKPGNKSRTTNHQHKNQNEHKGPDIRNIAKIITERYQQEDMYGGSSKDVAKQVPLWLVHQILNSEGQQSEQEKAKLFDSLKSTVDTPLPSTPSPGCPACAVSTKPNSPINEKQKHTRTTEQKNVKLHTPNTTISSKHKTTPVQKSVPIKSAPTKSYTTPRKQILKYSSPLPVAKTDRSTDAHLSAKHSTEELKCKGSPTPAHVRLSPGTPPSTKVSKGFKFKVMTPANRANLCRERKMNAYTSKAFQDVVWPLPLVHGQAFHTRASQNSVADRRSSSTSPTGKKVTTPREVSRPVEGSSQSRNVATGYTNITPKHKLVVHVCS